MSKSERYISAEKTKELLGKELPNINDEIDRLIDLVPTEDVKAIPSTYGAADKFGNNTDFPDTILGDITIKGLLGKWTQTLYKAMRTAIEAYFSDETAVSGKEYTKSQFKEARTLVERTVPVLKDLVSDRVCRTGDVYHELESVFVAIFGDESVEMFVFDTFRKLNANMNAWENISVWENREMIVSKDALNLILRLGSARK